MASKAAAPTAEAWSDGLSRILRVEQDGVVTTYVWRVVTQTWHKADRERRLLDSDKPQPAQVAEAWMAAALEAEASDTEACA